MMIDTDYLIVGAGAMGMAFADVLLTESDSSMTIVDRRGAPGGHWNDAYPFVRLHQPSAFYGVNSRPLGEDRIDAAGPNAGLYELASGPEILAYYDRVMNRQFLPSGRVEYLPMSDVQDRSVVSRLADRTIDISANTRIVDASYMNVMVPSMRAPAYSVAAGVTCVPLNDLPRIARRAEGYVVVGAGKTGVDACLWLLDRGVDPDDIRWIMPRDSWFLDRANIQPGDFFETTAERYIAQTRHVAQSTSIPDLFDRLEADGLLLRLDPGVTPTMYRCATVTSAELEQLRRITEVVRLGRVREIDADRIVLDEGTVPTTPGTVHVDCSADGLERRPVVPVFSDDRITLQTVRHCQQVFSAALIAHVEVAYDDTRSKNELCTVVPHPDSATDWIRTAVASSANMTRWSADPDLTAWLANARLDGFSTTVPPSDRLATAVLESLEFLADADANFTRYLAELEGDGS